MTHLLLFGLLVGLDNMIVGAGIGPLGGSRRQRWTLAVSFGLFEALMPLLGVGLAAELEVEWLGAAALLICGGLVLAGTLGAARFMTRDVALCSMLLLPLALSLDNLAAGAGLSALGLPVVPAALVVGGISAALALLGMAIGARLGRLLPVRPGLVSGTILTGLGAAALLSQVG